MKSTLGNRLRFVMFFSVVMTALTMAMPAQAQTFDINGAEIKASEAFVTAEGIMMVPLDLLTEHAHVTVVKSGEKIQLLSPDHKMMATMTLNSPTITRYGRTSQLASPVVEKNHTVFVPLRSLVAPWGEVVWQGDKKETLIRCDLNESQRPPLIHPQEGALRFKMIIDSGFDYQEENEYPQMMSSTEAVLFSKFDKEGIYALDSKGGNEALKPVHKDYRLRWFQVTPSARIWIETPAANAKEGSWHLYVQDGAEASPKELASAPYASLKKMPSGEAVLDNTVFAGDHVALLCGEPESGDLQVRLINIHTGEQKVLDTLPAQEAANGTFRLTMNDDVVIWKKVRFLENEKEYGDLYQYDLHTGQSAPLFPGCNFCMPTLVGSYLVVLDKPLGMDALDKDGQKKQTSDVWVWDMKKKQWLGRANEEVFGLNPKAHITAVTPMTTAKETVIIFNLEGVDSYPLPVWDLTTGQACLLKDAEGAPVMYSPVKKERGAVWRILSNSACNDFNVVYKHPLLDTNTVQAAELMR